MRAGTRCISRGPTAKTPIRSGTAPDASYFYFVHSFYACPSDQRHIAGVADYGGHFAAAIARDNIFATQFHPEKSADQGLALYRQFSALDALIPLFRSWP